jgi:hypothetical protein
MQDVLGKGPLELAPVGKDNEYMAIGLYQIARGKIYKQLIACFMKMDVPLLLPKRKSAPRTRSFTSKKRKKQIECTRAYSEVSFLETPSHRPIWTHCPLIRYWGFPTVLMRRHALTHLLHTPSRTYRPPVSRHRRLTKTSSVTLLRELALVNQHHPRRPEVNMVPT